MCVCTHDAALSDLSNVGELGVGVGGGGGGGAGSVQISIRDNDMARVTLFALHSLLMKQEDDPHRYAHPLTHSRSGGDSPCSVRYRL